jgi:hypothetical protein
MTKRSEIKAPFKSLTASEREAIFRLDDGERVTLAHLTGTSVDMIAKTYGHMDVDWVRKIQDRMSGKTPGPNEVREKPTVPYGQDLPRASSF